MYAGHENAIEVLDIADPGPDTSERLKTTSTRKERDGQKGKSEIIPLLVPFPCPPRALPTPFRYAPVPRPDPFEALSIPFLSFSIDVDADLLGIISSIVFCTDYSGTYAAGSFSGSAAIYSEDTAATAVAHLDGVHPGGVTQLAFHPLSPQTLFVGSRRSSSIQIFDLRDTSAPVGELARKGGTNQRLLFDVDPWGRWLASGDEDGTVKVWDITDLSKPPVLEEQLHQGGCRGVRRLAELISDAVGTVQLHPLKPLLLSVGGSRSFLHAPEAASISDSDTDSDFDNESDSGPDGSSSDSSNMGSEDAGRGTAMSGSAGGKSANSTSSPTAGPAASGTLSTRASTRLSAGAMDASLRVYSFA